MNYTITGGGVVISPHNKVLVVSQHGNSWSLPKGHVEKGENIKEAAQREITEETGITDLEFKKVLGTYRRHRIGLHGGEDTSELKTITIFLYTTSQTMLKPQDPDNPEARWIDIESVIPLLTHSKDKAFFLRTIDKLKDFIASREQ